MSPSSNPIKQLAELLDRVRNEVRRVDSVEPSQQESAWRAFVESLGASDTDLWAERLERSAVSYCASKGVLTDWLEMDVHAVCDASAGMVADWRWALRPHRTIDDKMADILARSGEFHEATADADESPTPDRATIISLGQRQYAIGDSGPIMVTESQDSVLQAFVGWGRMDKETLEKRSGYGSGPRILKKLRIDHEGCFADAIFLPGRRGNGGYRVAVRPA